MYERYKFDTIYQHSGRWVVLIAVLFLVVSFMYRIIFIDSDFEEFLILSLYTTIIIVLVTLTVFTLFKFVESLRE